MYISWCIICNSCTLAKAASNIVFPVNFCHADTLSKPQVSSHLTCKFKVLCDTAATPQQASISPVSALHASDAVAMQSNARCQTLSQLASPFTDVPLSCKDTVYGQLTDAECSSPCFLLACWVPEQTKTATGMTYLMSCRNSLSLQQCTGNIIEVIINTPAKHWILEQANTVTGMGFLVDCQKALLLQECTGNNTEMLDQHLSSFKLLPRCWQAG